MSPPLERLVHVLTVPASLRFLRGQPAFMREHGIETHVVCAPGLGLGRFARTEGAFAHPLPMERAITPAADLVTLARLTRLLRSLRADIVHAQTPKGGLLGVLAARSACVPRVIYHMRGLPLMGLRGSKQKLMTATERTACGLAHRVICHSDSLRELAVERGLTSLAKSTVLGPGGNGVDPARFDPSGPAALAATALREDLGIPERAEVVGFVGRLVRDKGIVDLSHAWRTLAQRFPSAHLVLVGPFEERDPVPHSTRRELEHAPRVHIVGETEDVAPYYALMDVLAFPSYREGFPNVPLEAAAMGVPTVAARVTGCVDAIADGVTGVLIPPGDAAALAHALARYIEDPERRLAHGSNAQDRARSEFGREGIWSALLGVYTAKNTSRRRRPWS